MRRGTKVRGTMEIAEGWTWNLAVLPPSAVGSPNVTRMRGVVRDVIEAKVIKIPPEVLTDKFPPLLVVGLHAAANSPIKPSAGGGVSKRLNPPQPMAAICRVLWPIPPSEVRSPVPAPCAKR